MSHSEKGNIYFGIKYHRYKITVGFVYLFIYIKLQ